VASKVVPAEREGLASNLIVTTSLERVPAIWVNLPLIIFIPEELLLVIGISAALLGDCVQKAE
jgi:hypothetical protein